ncbi:hypothetical protein ARMGADRAFT_1016682 [Armillaria gallica]|uniref:Uncharacterized protein n=1 Tax=Armillaria gallica TaxID=47427 RepID=A0A2H3DJA9_ARMGA|nr:hypothetical protein ARMGADRAFT_1016682 [Armillaria gallica]
MWETSSTWGTFADVVICHRASKTARTPSITIETCPSTVSTTQSVIAAVYQGLFFAADGGVSLEIFYANSFACIAQTIILILGVRWNHAYRATRELSVYAFKFRSFRI